MSSEETNQTTFNAYWLSGPGSPTTPVVGNPVANPVPTADLGSLGTGTVVNAVPSAMSQDITTMTNAVPHEDFPNGLPEPPPSQPPVQEAVRPAEPTLEAVAPPPVESKVTPEESNPPACSSGAPKFFPEVPVEVESEATSGLKKKKGKAQRRRLSANHREMIIDLVFNEKKTSREVARYMGLPQSTVMSVVQVFKKEHRIHKKTATGRKRRLTTAQEFQLFELSQARENISVDEIKNQFLAIHPEFGHISKTTIYRTLERGKGESGQENGFTLLEPSVSIMEDGKPFDGDKDSGRQRRSLSIAEREMIISLFFNENRTIREVADFMHLAKSTVSSVVQVFKKEHRIQRKTSTGRKRKLSSEHEQMIMEILSQKEDITIEETRNRFLTLNPEVPTISKSTIYRIMENCQSKLRARADMEVFIGTFIHSTDDNPMVILRDTVLGVLNSKFMIPGFIDTHIHASQFPNNGVAMDLPLLEWLQTYTFPTETNFSDTLFAREVYTKTVERLLRNGTTTAAYYATIHLEGSKILADVVYGKGQRAIIGKINMLRNCPEYYRESSLQESLQDTEEFLRYVTNMQSPLVKPAVTPRFAPTCPEDQLASLGQLANKFNCHVQSHLCETQPECNWVKELFPWSENYTDVYDKMQLLHEKTIMAHCIWLSDEEICVLRERGVGVSHCPNSNISIRSGLCDVRRLLFSGLKVGLGTDCSGGFSSSMLDAIRHALQVSNVLSFDRDQDYQRLTYKEAFRMSTLGGAKALNLEDKIGSFEIDKEFDALLIDVAAPGTALDIFLKDSLEDKIQKFIYCGDDRNIARVYVAGNRILDLHNKSVH